MVIAVLAIGVGGAYWYRSRKMLRGIAREAEGIGVDERGQE